MNPEAFRRVAHNNNKSVYTDEELLEQIETLQCLVAYFNARREGLVGFALTLELRSFESMAQARRWECKNEKWQVRRADGTFA